MSGMASQEIPYFNGKVSHEKMGKQTMLDYLFKHGFHRATETYFWYLLMVFKELQLKQGRLSLGSKCPIAQNPPILKCVLFQFQPSRSFFAGFFEVAKAIIDRTNLVWARHELGFHHQKWSFCWDFYPSNIMENWDFTEFVGGYNRISIES